MNALMQKTLEDRAEAEASKTRAERDAQEKNKDILNMERACALLEQKKVTSSMEEKQIVDKLWDSYEPDPRHRPGASGGDRERRRRKPSCGRAEAENCRAGYAQPGRHRGICPGQRALHLPRRPAGRRADLQAGAGKHHPGHHQRDDHHFCFGIRENRPLFWADF